MIACDCCFHEIDFFILTNEETESLFIHKVRKKNAMGSFSWNLLNAVGSIMFTLGLVLSGSKSSWDYVLSANRDVAQQAHEHYVCRPCC